MEQPPFKPRAFPPPVPLQMLRASKARAKRKLQEQWSTAAAVVLGGFGVLFFISCVLAVVSQNGATRIEWPQKELAVEQAREIAAAMRAYSLDHKGVYPDGKTSTEVFQQLLNGKYLTDPEIFYVKMAGKTKPDSTTLTADNVCFDVTSGVTADSPDQLPIVFCTGYSVTYFPGDSAFRNVVGSTPSPGAQTDYSGNSDETGGLAMASKGADSRFVHADTYGAIHFFIPTDFDSRGKTYRQLKP